MKMLKFTTPLLLILFLCSEGCIKSDYQSISQKNTNGSTSTNQGGSASATLAWNPNTEANLTGYKVYYGTASNNLSKSVDVGLPTVSNGAVSYKFSALVSGQTYYFAVVAYDEYATESGLSNVVSMKVP
jgi:fibronectin type 3 domain-containing protein